MNWLIDSKSFNGMGKLVNESGEMVACIPLPLWGVPWNEAYGQIERPENAEALSNARLISAAPDMLEVLRSVDNIFANNEYAEQFPHTARSIRDALAKATGIVVPRETSCPDHLIPLITLGDGRVLCSICSSSPMREAE